MAMRIGSREGCPTIRPMSRCQGSYRIDGTVSMLLALGGRENATSDGAVVSGPILLLGGSFDARCDHRVFLAAAVAGLVARETVAISDPWCFRSSYPSFFDDM